MPSRKGRKLFLYIIPVEGKRKYNKYAKFYN